MTTSKNRLEAFSDGMFSIILTILVLEIHAPEIHGHDWGSFVRGVAPVVPKFVAFVFSFFLLATFWVNHHHIVHAIQRVDAKLLWLNVAFLFFACLFPFLTAFIGDNPTNPWVVALFPLNMACDALVLGALWKYAFVDTDLAPNTLTHAEKKRRMRTDNAAALINLVNAGLAFVWVPITLAVLVIMPLFFVVPQMVSRAGQLEE